MKKEKNSRGFSRRMEQGALLIFLCIVFLCACSPFDPLEAEKSSVLESEQENENLISVGFSQLGSESIWRTANTNSVKSTLTEENGFFLLFDNARQMQEKQIKALRSFISQRVDVIVFCPVRETGWDTVLEEAKEAGVPVIVLDRAISVADESLYTCFVGEDMREEGVKAGRWLEQELEKKGKEEEKINIVVLQGTEGSSAQLGRSNGFATIAARHSNWKLMAQNGGDFTEAKGKEVMSRFLNEFNDIDVVVAQNDDMAFGAIDALEEAGIRPGEDVLVISFDGSKRALQYVEEGKINVDVECNPLSGPLLSDVIRKVSAGMQVEKQYYMEEKVFTKENAGGYLEDREY